MIWITYIVKWLPQFSKHPSSYIDTKLKKYKYIFPCDENS